MKLKKHPYLWFEWDWGYVKVSIDDDDALFYTPQVERHEGMMEFTKTHISYIHIYIYIFIIYVYTHNIIYICFQK